MKKTLMTLSIPISEEGKVLLGMKKRGFGEGFWNGFGGKVEKDEKIIESAKRELQEEAGVQAEYLFKAGEIVFTHNYDDEVIEMPVFRIEKILGQPKETEEMKPQWFLFEEIPYDKMWPDDSYWLPLFLEKKLFKAKFIFNRKNELQSFKVQEVKTL